MITRLLPVVVPIVVIQAAQQLPMPTSKQPIQDETCISKQNVPDLRLITKTSNMSSNNTNSTRTNPSKNVLKFFWTAWLAQMSTVIVSCALQPKHVVVALKKPRFVLDESKNDGMRRLGLHVGEF
jgi:hypothetical protein